MENFVFSDSQESRLLCLHICAAVPAFVLPSARRRRDAWASAEALVRDCADWIRVIMLHSYCVPSFRTSHRSQVKMSAVIIQPAARQARLGGVWVVQENVKRVHHSVRSRTSVIRSVTFEWSRTLCNKMQREVKSRLCWLTIKN